MGALKRYRLPLVVFVCGAVVMAFELVGSRVLAPTIGSSLFVWTSLIGIILASLSVGYYYGGRIADRYPEADRMALIIWLASIGITATATFHNALLLVLSTYSLDIRIAATIAGVVLFAPASVALGMVSPYAARLALRDMHTSGSIVGVLSASSTVGSIAGTFLTGWVLIGYLGTTSVLYLLAVVALGASFLAYVRYRTVGRLCTLALIIALALGERAVMAEAAQGGFIDTDTKYQRAQILIGTSADGQPVRYLRTDPFGAQSSVYLDSPDLAASYTQAFQTITDLLPAVQRALVIGGGGQVWPTQFIRDYPRAAMDVVEIDPGLLRLASDYFGFRPHAGLRVVHEDGRTFLNRQHDGYDIIFIDAYAGTTIPVQLTTREAVARMSAAIEPDGIVVSNVIGAVDGAGNQLLRAMYATYRSVFEHVHIIMLAGAGSGHQLQNILLVSSHTPFVLPESLLPLSRPDVVADASLVLTDDFSPVERYSASLRWGID